MAVVYALLVGYLFRSPLWLLGWVALAAAFVFQALALHAGQMSVVQPLLSVSQPFLVIVDPIVSIALSVWIFDEYFTESPLRLTLGGRLLHHPVRRRGDAYPGGTGDNGVPGPFNDQPGLSRDECLSPRYHSDATQDRAHPATIGQN